MIDPGGAFGTGTHPTTRMCLELILEAPAKAGRRDSRSFYDLGCGSGVLAIAAAKLGFDPVLGVDADIAAIEETVAQRPRQRRRAGAAPRRICAGSRAGGRCRGREPDGGTADAVAQVWSRARRAARHAIVSGILREEADGVAAALAEAGLSEQQRLVVRRDWAAVVASLTHMHVTLRGQVPRLQGLPGRRDAGPCAAARSGPRGGARSAGRPPRGQHLLHHARGRGEVPPVGAALRRAMGRRRGGHGLRCQPERRAVRRDRRVGDGPRRDGRRRRRGGGGHGGSRLHRHRARSAARNLGESDPRVREGPGRLRLPLLVLHHPEGARRRALTTGERGAARGAAAGRAGTARDGDDRHLGRRLSRPRARARAGRADARGRRDRGRGARAAVVGGGDPRQGLARRGAGRGRARLPASARPAPVGRRRRAGVDGPQLRLGRVPARDRTPARAACRA